MKYIIILTLLTVSLLATPSKVIYIPNTSYNSMGVLHLDVDNYFIQGQNKVTKSEFGLNMQFLPFKKLKLVAGIDYKANLNSPIYLSGKLVIPMKQIPNIALGVFNIGVTTQTLKPIYYLLLSKRFKEYGKILLGGYYGDKDELRDSNGDVDNKGLLIGYEVYLKEFSNNLYFGTDYFMGDNFMSAISVGIGWKFAKNVLIKFSYHIKLKKNKSNQLSLQININTF